MTTTESGHVHRRMTAPRFLNPLVGAVLRSPVHRILSRRLMLVQVRGRRTGRITTFPVGYLQDGDTLDVLVGDFRTKTWWRNLQGGARTRVRLRGRTIDATGEILRWESDEPALRAALARCAAASAFTRRALRITGRPGALEPSSLQRAARDVVIVRITLDHPGPGAATGP